MNNNESNKRIAKNTVYLYMRMLLVMAVSLYTSRVILIKLGTTDFGLYSVIGGVVATLSFVSQAMANATSRFMTYALGEGDLQNQKSVFSSSFWIHTALAILILIIAETAGLWFLNTKMNIPSDRLYAANWVYQFSIITSLFSIVCAPFYSTIIANEKMGYFAFISIFDVFAKLAIVYLIGISQLDKLILYGLCLMIIQIFDMLLYVFYCVRHFEEVSIKMIDSFKHIKKIGSFAGWSLIGNLSCVCCTQGLNILLNIFFGPVVNAARGIAVQVQTAVMNFVQNFQTAINPQITISYAQNNFSRLQLLVNSSSRFSFYILLCMFLPLTLGADMFLSIWLESVPEHSSAFLRLVLLISLVSCLERPLTMAMNATGNIKKYQIVSCGILLLILPISLIALKFGMPAEIVFFIQLILSIVSLFSEVLILYKYIRINVKIYFTEVISPITKVFFISCIVPLFCYCCFGKTFGGLISVVFISIASVVITVYAFGIQPNERSFFKSKIKSMLSVFKN